MNRLKENSNKSDESFFQRMKNDKKYNAKVQFIGYGIFIVVLIVMINLSNMGSTKNAHQSLVDYPDDSVLQEQKQGDFMKSVLDNYEYEIQVNLKQKNEQDEEVTKQVQYSGKSYGDSLEIHKVFLEQDIFYYKVADLYYEKSNEEYLFSKEDVIYEGIDANYLEIAGIRKLLNQAELDRVTDYSSGKKEYVYHLSIHDVVRSYQGDDFIEFKLELENDIWNIQVDYTKLFQVLDQNIEECSLKFRYFNIGKVAKFSVLEQNEKIEEE